jgi:hypothetical protein
VITEAHLRLRAVPRADVTLSIDGTRDALLDAARAVLERGMTPAALELLSPAAASREAWRLAIRLLGTEAEVAADQTEVQAALPTAAAVRRGTKRRVLERSSLETAAEPPVTLRLGHPRRARGRARPRGPAPRRTRR